MGHVEVGWDRAQGVGLGVSQPWPIIFYLFIYIYFLVGIPYTNLYDIISQMLSDIKSDF